MKNPGLIFFAFTMLFYHATYSQEAKSISVGTEYQLSSALYGAERKLQVSLPQDYDTSARNYPVLYLLDGQDWFLEAVSIRHLLTRYEYAPDFIIVGIDTQDTPRYGFFANSEKLQRHLEEELIPFIEAKFRTSGDRLLFGWQFSAAFTIQTLGDKPQLFNGWLAASPFPIDVLPLKAVKKSLEENQLNAGTIVFATSLNENHVEPGAQQLADLLEKNAPESVHWQYKRQKHETEISAGHRSTPIGTLYSGLRTYFRDYPNLEFNTLADYQSAGGLDFVNSYYQNRGLKYGISTEISQEGMFFLIRMSLDANHYPTFESLMDRFSETTFLENINLGWNMQYAEFFLTNNNPAKAITLLEQLTTRFPENARPVNAIGRCYEALNNKEQAIQYFSKAVSLAERHEDSRLESYRTDLARLKNND